MSIAVLERVERKDGIAVPKTIKEIVELSLRAGVKEDEIEVVKPTPRDPVLRIRNRAVASWLPLR